jgi:hypothetical protein
MTMADPLTIVGAAATSAQLLEQAFKITQLVYEVYSKIRKAPAFVAERLDHIEQLIGIAKVIQQSAALQTNEIAAALNVCLDKTRKIHLKLKEALPGDNDKRWHRMKKSLVVVFQKNDFVTLFEDLDREKASLILAIQSIQP